MLKVLRNVTEAKGGPISSILEKGHTVIRNTSGIHGQVTSVFAFYGFRNQNRAYSAGSSAGTEGQSHHEPSVGTGSGFSGSCDSRRTMRAWEINSYSGPEMLQLNETAKLPVIRNPEEVLVRVKAASVNPLDVEMTKGYGAQVFQTLRHIEKGKICSLRQSNVEFPLTMGRDFSGIVVETGAGVNDVKVGDEVYGVLRFTEHGSHAEYTVARQDLVSL